LIYYIQIHSYILTIILKFYYFLYYIILSVVFLLIGWIFNFKQILLLHIIIVIGTIIYWTITQHLCDLTVYVNKLCGWEEKQSFNDLLNIFGIKKIKWWNNIWHYFVIIIAACICLYKIVYYK